MILSVGYREKSSEIILVPNACYMSKIRLEQLKVRAYGNRVGIVSVKYAQAIIKPHKIIYKGGLLWLKFWFIIMIQTG